ncbi:hypothetical protein PM030_14330, partial [Halorubrum ezzemoulense]|uniref:hypothetical protein n=1 Tax=Halorubrum ezzemoulense TaxID=337243 RepID=UPI00232FB65A
CWRRGASRDAIHTKNFVESSAIMRLCHGLTLCRLSRPRGKHVPIDKQHLELDGLVAEDGSIKEADAHTQRVGERAYLVRFPEDGEVPTLLELVGRA